MLKSLFSAIALCLCFAISAQTASKMPNFGKNYVTKVVENKPLIRGEFKKYGIEINVQTKTVHPYTVCPVQQKPFIMTYQPKDCTNTYGNGKMSIEIVTDNKSVVTIFMALEDVTKIIGYKYRDMTKGGETTEEGDTTL